MTLLINKKKVTTAQPSYNIKIMYMIDLLLFNANFSSISAMSWHKIMYMIDLLLFNAKFSSISAMVFNSLSLCFVY
jgi:hypothetical protein